eukprot:TRINITY_DN5190_c0_g1_i1.p1 TRINITY_DN5190_c0_g1~~TRINITY_DN5190_c0_g1_i1.p1  ORF type:complete len:2278 (+),score=628.74 TRINITY_DN5190_c0_g1_i1:714-6836(+)
MPEDLFLLSSVLSNLPDPPHTLDLRGNPALAGPRTTDLLLELLDSNDAVHSVLTDGLPAARQAEVDRRLAANKLRAEARKRDRGEKAARVEAMKIQRILAARAHAMLSDEADRRRCTAERWRVGALHLRTLLLDGSEALKRKAVRQHRRRERAARAAALAQREQDHREALRSRWLSLWLPAMERFETRLRKDVNTRGVAGLAIIIAQALQCRGDVRVRERVRFLAESAERDALSGQEAARRADLEKQQEQRFSEIMRLEERGYRSAVSRTRARLDLEGEERFLRSQVAEEEKGQRLWIVKLHDIAVEQRRAELERKRQEIVRAEHNARDLIVLEEEIVRPIIEGLITTCRGIFKARELCATTAGERAAHMAVVPMLAVRVPDQKPHAYLLRQQQNGTLEQERVQSVPERGAPIDPTVRLLAGLPFTWVSEMQEIMGKEAREAQLQAELFQQEAEFRRTAQDKLKDVHSSSCADIEKMFGEVLEDVSVHAGKTDSARPAADPELLRVKKERILGGVIKFTCTDDTELPPKALRQERLSAMRPEWTKQPGHNVIRGRIGRVVDLGGAPADAPEAANDSATLEMHVPGHGATFDTVLEMLQGCMFHSDVDTVSNPLARQILVNVSLWFADVEDETDPFLSPDCPDGTPPRRVVEARCSCVLAVVVCMPYVFVPQESRSAKFTEGDPVEKTSILTDVQLHDPPMITRHRGQVTVAAGSVGATASFGGLQMMTLDQGQIILEFVFGYTMDDLVVFKSGSEAFYTEADKQITYRDSPVLKVSHGALCKPGTGRPTTGSCRKIVLDVVSPLANAEVLRRVLLRLRFCNTSLDPVEGPRHILMTVNDASGLGTCVLLTVVVFATDNPATLDVPNTKLLYHFPSPTTGVPLHLRQFQPQQEFFPCGETSIIDVDTEHFCGGHVRASIGMHAQRGDVLTFADCCWEDEEDDDGDGVAVPRTPRNTDPDRVSLRKADLRNPLVGFEMPSYYTQDDPPPLWDVFYGGKRIGVLAFYDEPKHRKGAAHAAHASPGMAAEQKMSRIPSSVTAEVVQNTADEVSDCEGSEESPKSRRRSSSSAFGPLVAAEVLATPAVHPLDAPHAVLAESGAGHAAAGRRAARGRSATVTAPKEHEADGSSEEHRSPETRARSATGVRHSLRAQRRGTGGSEASAAPSMTKQPSVQRLGVTPVTPGLSPGTQSLGGIRRRGSAPSKWGRLGNRLGSLVSGGVAGSNPRHDSLSIAPRLDGLGGVAMTAVETKARLEEQRVSAMFRVQPADTRAAKELLLQFCLTGEASIRAAQAVLRSLVFIPVPRAGDYQRSVEFELGIGQTALKMDTQGEKKMLTPELVDVSFFHPPLRGSIQVRVTPPLVSIAPKAALLKYVEGSGAARLAPFEVAPDTQVDGYDGGFVRLELVDGLSSDDVLILRDSESLSFSVRELLDAPSVPLHELVAAGDKLEEERAGRRLPPRAGTVRKQQQPASPEVTRSGSKRLARLASRASVLGRLGGGRTRKSFSGAVADASAHGDGISRYGDSKLGNREWVAAQQRGKNPGLDERTVGSSLTEVFFEGRLLGVLSSTRGALQLSLTRSKADRDPSLGRKEIAHVLKNLAYANTSRCPQVLVKVVRMTLSDGSLISSVALIEIQIQPVDDPTEIMLKSDRVRYRPCPDDLRLPLCIAPMQDAWVEDPDTEHFDGGHISAELVGGAMKGDTLCVLTLEQQDEMLQRLPASHRPVSPDLHASLLSDDTSIPRVQTFVGRPRRSVVMTPVTEPVSQPSLYRFQLRDAPRQNEKLLVAVDGSFSFLVTYTPSKTCKDAQDVRIAFTRVSKAAPPVVTQPLVTYLLNCIAFTTLARDRMLKEGVRTVQIRVSDGVNPQEGRQRLTVDVRAPFVALPPTPVLVAAGGKPQPLAPRLSVSCGEGGSALTQGYIQIEVERSAEYSKQLECTLVLNLKEGGFHVKDSFIYQKSLAVCSLAVNSPHMLRFEFTGQTKGATQKHLASILRNLAIRSMARADLPGGSTLSGAFDGIAVKFTGLCDASTPQRVSTVEVAVTTVLP